MPVMTIDSTENTVSILNLQRSCPFFGSSNLLVTNPLDGEVEEYSLAEAWHNIDLAEELQNQHQIRFAYKDQNLVLISEGKCDVALNLSNEDLIKNLLVISNGAVSLTGTKQLHTLQIKAKDAALNDDINVQKLVVDADKFNQSKLSRIEINNGVLNLNSVATIDGELKLNRVAARCRSFAVAENAKLSVRNCEQFNFRSIISSGTIVVKNTSAAGKDLIAKKGELSITDSQIYMQDLFSVDAAQLSTCNVKLQAKRLKSQGITEISGSRLDAEQLSLMSEANVINSELHITKNIDLSNRAKVNFEYSLLRAPSYFSDGETSFLNSEVDTEFFQQNARATYNGGSVKATRFIGVNDNLKSANTKFITQGQFKSSAALEISSGSVKTKSYVQAAGSLRTSKADVKCDANMLLGAGTQNSIAKGAVSTDLFVQSGNLELKRSDISANNAKIFAELALKQSTLENTDLFLGDSAHLKLNKTSNLQSENMEMHGNTKLNPQSNAKVTNYHSGHKSQTAIGKDAGLNVEELKQEGDIRVKSGILSSKSTDQSAKLSLSHGALAALGDLTQERNGVLHAKKGSEIYTNDALMKGELDCEDGNLKATGSVTSDLHSNARLSKSSLIARGSYTQEGHLDASDAIISAGAEIRSSRTATTTGESLTLQSKHTELNGTTELTGLLAVAADTIEMTGTVRAEQAELMGDQSVKIKTAIISESMTVDSNNFTMGSGSSFKGSKLSVASLNTVLEPGSRVDSTNFTIQSLAFFNLGAVVNSYNYMNDVIVNFDMGISVPTIPSKITDVVNTEKAINVLLTMSSMVSRPVGAVANIVYKCRGLYQQAPKLKATLQEEYKKDLGKRRLRHVLAPVLAAKSIFNSVSSMARDLNSGYQGFTYSSEDVSKAANQTFNNEFAQQLATETAKVGIATVAPNMSTEAVFSANTGAKASYTVNESTTVGLNTGLQTGINVRYSASKSGNFGTMAAQDLAMDLGDHYNAGAETATNNLKVDAANYTQAAGSKLASSGTSNVHITQNFTSAGAVDLVGGSMQVDGKADLSETADAKFTQINVVATELDSRGKTSASETTFKGDKANLTGENQFSNVELGHKETKLDGVTNYKNNVLVTSEKFTTAKGSVMHAESGAHCEVQTHKSDMQGAHNFASMHINDASMSGEEVAHLMQGTVAHANKVGQNLSVATKEEVTLGKIERDAATGISLVAAAVTVTQNIDQRRVYLQATDGDANLKADVHGAEGATVVAAQDINKQYVKLTSSTGNASVECGGTLRNQHGVIAADQGRAQAVAGRVENNTTGASTAKSTIKGQTTLVKATTDALDNTGGQILGSVYAQAEAKTDVILEAKQTQEFRGHGTATVYEAGIIQGGAGTEETNGVGTYIHAENRVLITASHAGSADGKTVIKGDKCVDAKTVSNTYQAYNETHDHGMFNEVHTEGDATVVGLTSIHGQHVTIEANDGKVSLHGVATAAVNGIDVLTKETGLLESHVYKERHREEKTKVGVIKKDKTTTSEREVVNVIATNTGDIRMHATNGGFEGDGTVFVGGAGSTLEFDVNGPINLGRRKLETTVTEKSVTLGFSVAGQSLTGGGPHSLADRLGTMDPALASVQNLFRNHNAAAAVDAYNCLDAATNLAARIAQDGVLGVLQNATSVAVSVNKNSSTTTTQHAGAGGIYGPERVTIRAAGHDVTLGLDVQDVKEMDVKAKSFVLQNQELHSSQNTKQQKFTTSVNPAGEVSERVEQTTSKSSAVTQTQGVFQVGKLNLDVDLFELNGFIALLDDLTGRADKIVTNDKMNSYNSTTKHVSADTNGNVSASKTNHESANVGAIGSLHVKNGIDSGKFSMKEYENTGSAGITTDNPAQNILNTDPSIKQTQHNLHEFSRTNGSSIGLNLQQLTDPNPDSVDMNFGKSSSNYQATLGANGREVTHDTSYVLDVRLHLENSIKKQQQADALAQAERAKELELQQEQTTKTQAEESSQAENEGSNDSTKGKKSPKSQSKSDADPAAKEKLAKNDFTKDEKGLDASAPKEVTSQPNTQQTNKQSLWERLFENPPETDFYERKVNGPEEAKIGAGLVIGYLESALESALDVISTANRALGAAERFDDTYNSDTWTEATDRAKEELYQDHVATKQAIIDTKNGMAQAAQAPLVALADKAITFGKDFFDAVQKSKQEPFAAGVDIGKNIREKQEFMHTITAFQVPVPGAKAAIAQLFDSYLELQEQVDQRRHQGPGL